MALFRKTDERFDAKLSRLLRQKCEQYKTTGPGSDPWLIGGYLYLLKDKPPLLKFAFISIPAPREYIAKLSWKTAQPDELVIAVYDQKNYHAMCARGESLKFHLKLRLVHVYLTYDQPPQSIFGRIG